ncbi:BspA family leucine-rich repeat surface protein [Lactobacillus paragasseri]|nr:BspA family leucine-rich repeat surface protein [Lactobacillus paragasseri]MDK7068077.1 BspA family leucine-rich repeat surface protein [Lactobacillus paragasseri]
MKQMDLTNLDTSNLTDMSGMFCGAYKVKSLGNLSGWDVSHVTNMQQMFDENTYDSPALESLDGINKWNVSNVQNILCLFRNDTNLKDIDISGWDLSKATGGWTTGQVFASFTNASKTVINLNNVKLPSDFNFATSFANGQVVITNNGDLLQLDTTSKVPFKDNLTFRQYNSWGDFAHPTVKNYSHSIFYDSKGSSDAKAIVQGAIDTFLHNNYANYKKATIPTNAVYLSTKPSDSATAIANGIYDIAKTNEADTTYYVFRDDEIPMQLKYLDKNGILIKNVTIVGNGINVNGMHAITADQIANALGSSDITKNDVNIQGGGLKYFGFDGITDPVTIYTNESNSNYTRQEIPNTLEQRTITIHLYERGMDGKPVLDENGKNVSVAPDLKATFTYHQYNIIDSAGNVAKSKQWLWDTKAPKTYDGATPQKVTLSYVDYRDNAGKNHVITANCWKIPVDKSGENYILVPNDGSWNSVEFSTPKVDGYYANPFMDNSQQKTALPNKPANLFVNPSYNDPDGRVSDPTETSIAYTNAENIYENKSEHTIWYYPIKGKSSNVSRTISFVKDDKDHTQLKAPIKSNLTLDSTLTAADPTNDKIGNDIYYKAYYHIVYPGEYNDVNIVMGSPIVLMKDMLDISKSTIPTYTWKPTDNQETVTIPNISGYKISAVKIGNSDYSSDSQDIALAKSIAQNTEILQSAENLNVSFAYVPLNQTSSYQFVDDNENGAKVGNVITINGVTDETIDVTKDTKYKVPDNYELVTNQNLNYKFKASDNEQLKIHLIHQKKVLSDDTRTIRRKVTITDPDGKVDPKSTTQSVTFSRNDILDKVTNKHIYGKWNEAQQTLPSIDLPSFNGYTPTGEVTAAEVTTNSGDIADINISYVPNEQTSYYEFVDDDNHESLIAPATVISGRTGETIKLNIVTPNGYALAKDITLPRSYRFKATNNEPIIIHLVHYMSKVTNDPKLTKVITRTINVINPDGTTDSIVQTVRFVQTATKDDVTNSVSYMNDWKNVGAESFAEYNVPEIAGYTSSKTKVEKLTPKFGDQNVIVNIDYIKKSQINPVKPVKPIVTPIEKDNKEQSANKQQTVTAEPNSKPKVTQEIKQPVSKPNKTNGKILERKDRQTYKFQGQTVTMKKVVNAKEAGHINKIKAKKAALPQTGNDEAKTTAIIASGLAVDLSLIGLAGLKKKRSN